MSTSSLREEPGGRTGTARLLDRFQDAAVGLLSRILGGRSRLNLAETVGQDLRVIEVDAGADQLGLHLFAAGWRRYLRLARDPECTPERTPAKSEVDRRTIRYESADQILENNAELLILSGHSGRHLSKVSRHRNAEYVLWAPGITRSFLAELLGLVWKVTSGRIEALGRVALPIGRGQLRSFLLIRLKNLRLPSARRYLSPLQGIEGFFRELNKQRLEYVVLRGFGQLSEAAEGEDRALLVSDRDVDAVLSLLDEEPGTIALEAYSASGLRGTDDSYWMPYYPPVLAREILQGAILHDDGFRVPRADHRFLSLAYHVLYHRGEGSGLPLDQHHSQGVNSRGHAHAAVLGRLAVELGIQTEITLESLDALLAGKGWRPPLDTLFFLAHAIPEHGWLRAKLPAMREEVKLREYPALQHDGFSMFVLRQKVVEYGLVQIALDAIAERGFTVLKVIHLDSAAKTRVQNALRGGNWTAGGSGDPVIVVPALDLMPIPLSGALQRINPKLGNGRLGEKSSIREHLNQQLPSRDVRSMLHTSDCATEATHYLAVAAPEMLKEINDKIAQLTAEFETSYPVLQNLSGRGTRAKTELIDYHGNLAVKKTFRPGAERFLERERHALSSFSGIRSEVPPVLESGDNYYIRPYYENTLEMSSRSGRLIPLKVARQAIDALRWFYESGMSLINFRPDNLLLDPREGLKIINFEFLYHYRDRPKSFDACYELVGFPPDFDGDKPLGRCSSYERTWFPVVGLELSSLLHDPAWLQHLKRARYRLASGSGRIVQRLTRVVADRCRLVVRNVRTFARRERTTS